MEGEAEVKVVSEEERQDKETSHELEKKMLHLEHDIAILKAKVMEISTLKSERAALKSQALRFVQQLSNQVQNMISSVGNDNRQQVITLHRIEGFSGEI
ncbi:hypothetical protein CFP56_025765 [Quercus suber]|uniref:Uncharacterized protein n=1 Tax=Quercus suber TaxID=58331 RepID=A0AAW0K1N8_QUESU